MSGTETMTWNELDEYVENRHKERNESSKNMIDRLRQETIDQRAELRKQDEQILELQTKIVRLRNLLPANTEEVIAAGGYLAIVHPPTVAVPSPFVFDMIGREERELDRRIAETIFGYSDIWQSDDGYMTGWRPGLSIEDDKEPIPEYSTDIASAFTVVDHIEAHGWYLKLHGPFLDHEDPCFPGQTDHWATFLPTGIAEGNSSFHRGHGPTRSEAICWAALAWAEANRGE